MARKGAAAEAAPAAPAQARRAGRGAAAARGAPAAAAAAPAAAPRGRASRAAAAAAAAPARRAAAAADSEGDDDGSDDDDAVPFEEAGAEFSDSEDGADSDAEVGGGAAGARFGAAFRASLRAGGDHASDDEAADEGGAGAAAPPAARSRRRTAAAAAAPALAAAVPAAAAAAPARRRTRAAAPPSAPAAAAAADDGSDSSEDERAPRNTVGNVPMSWYAEEPHVGYDLDGAKLLKKAGAGERGTGGDALDAFLARADSSRAWRTLYDEVNDETYTLSSEEVALIRRLREGKLPHGEEGGEGEGDPYAPYVDWADFDGALGPKGPGGVRHPFSNAPEPKRRFLPSAWEAKAVVKLVRALRRGWIKPAAEREAARAAAAAPKLPFLLWDEAADDAAGGGGRDKTGSGLARIAPPKPKLPGHEESYNPPLEYVPTEEEKAALAAQAEYTGRPVFVPQRFAALRGVPSYGPFVRERFERCLDLYLCPRVARSRLNVDPASLLPALPKPRELQPYPAAECIAFEGHAGPLRCVGVDGSGEWLATGGDDACVRIWQLATGRCVGVIAMDAAVHALAWCPRAGTRILAAAAGTQLALLDVSLHTGPAMGPDADAEAAAAAAWSPAPAASSLRTAPPRTPPGVAAALAALAACSSRCACPRAAWRGTTRAITSPLCAPPAAPRRC
jgi:ribosome biogenesis protein ERB1